MAVAILGFSIIVEVGWSLKCTNKVIRNCIKSMVSNIQLREIEDFLEAVQSAQSLFNPSGCNHWGNSQIKCIRYPVNLTSPKPKTKHEDGLKYLQLTLTLDPDYIEKRSYRLSHGQQLNSDVYLYVYANSQATHYSIFLFPITHTPHPQTVLSASIAAHLCL